ncbi:hypothetical protein G7Z17_g7830 [Cylindrodendrum hubeiense]|uniref:Uncharacterized protein n=1 Tax=Cylindrodendrum hubeiense TaxID=595255 RepID=A0A9P5HCG7_9HYPO|nr:hypothetical protein G7Z17_g7830 [Cylindrodendrum hubeiense]
MPCKDDAQDGEGISVLGPESLTTMNKTRHEVLELAYEEYLKGRILKVDPVITPSLELLSHLDLTLESSRDPETNEITELQINKASNPDAINFMA